MANVIWAQDLRSYGHHTTPTKVYDNILENKLTVGENIIKGLGCIYVPRHTNTVLNPNGNDSLTATDKSLRLEFEELKTKYNELLVPIHNVLCE